jgi:hypothetical protein
MTMTEMKLVADELRPILARIRATKETLGTGEMDCVYIANKQLEPVVFRLSELIEAFSKEETK